MLGAKGDAKAEREMYVKAFGICCRSVGPRSLYTLTSAENLLTVGVDPIGLARQIAGEAVADELQAALAEQGS